MGGGEEAGVLSPVLSPCSSCLLSSPGQPEYVREDEWEIRPSSPPSQRMPHPPVTRPGGQNVAKSIQRLRRPPVPRGKAERQAPSQALRPVKAKDDLRPLVQVVKEMEAQGRAEAFQLPDVSCTAEPSSPSPKGGSPQPVHGCKIKPDLLTARVPVPLRGSAQAALSWVGSLPGMIGGGLPLSSPEFIWGARST